MNKNNPHWGTTVDAFLAEEGIREAAKAEAVTRVVVWQLSQEMERQGIYQGKARRADAHQPRPGRSHPQGNVAVDGLQLGLRRQRC